MTAGRPPFAGPRGPAADPDEDWAERRLTHFVAGDWRAPLSVRMGEGPMVLAGSADVARALAAARAAAAGWRALGGEGRAALLGLGQALPDAQLPGPGLGPVLVLGRAGPRRLTRMMAGGAAVVLLRPAPLSPGLVWLAERLRRAGLPPGVLSLLTGPPEAAEGCAQIAGICRF